MKKYYITIYGLLLVAFLFNSCKTNIIEVPPPDYIDIMTKAGTFKMFKRFDSGTEEDRLFKSRNADIVIKKSPTPNEVLFEETYKQSERDVTVTYRVTLVEPTAFSNAVKLSIARQTINNETYEGTIHPDLASSNLQGFFEAFDANDKKNPKTPVNRLIFAIRVNGERWLYGAR